MSTGAIVGIVVSGVVLFVGLVLVAIYAFRQKRRAERATKISKPFGIVSQTLKKSAFWTWISIH